MATISVELLMQCIEQATVEKEIAVRDDDYYARRNDITFETVRFVDAAQLLTSLQALLE